MIRQAVLEYDHADDALERLDELIAGRRAHVLRGQNGFDVVKRVLPAITAYPTSLFRGECTDAEVERLRLKDVDVLLAVGGGKLVDTAKLVAYRQGVPLIVIPTLASNCAAFTPLSVIYDEQGAYDRYDVFRVVIERVIVDARVVTDSPYDYFRAGVIDTVAKFYEARYLSGDSSADAGVNTGLALAEQCGRLVELDLSESSFTAYGPETRFAVDHILAVGGAVGGFGDAGTRVAVAHAVHNALSRFESTHPFLHGDKVGFGLLVQERLRGSSDAPYLEAWLARIGAPTSLETLGLVPADIPQLVDAVRAETELQRSPVPLDIDYLKIIFENSVFSVYK
ncbi:iron-containing alcohol dehydrogenase [Exiguobacterium sp. SH3S2]|uniref:iron-containing alcohol dehydrogenase n=1 Tax=unclassified Exiguobacterium TaxID=2644629 RepID=UPI00103E95AE|nr:MULTISPECIES: iron-containing alcohol dehydrogenase [unclassified Exiguobacterium]TCI45779.1 iron-containing alcohol dehydrogenase [Exiguobacterium sp. SH3S3]TCI60988.1 iron-containing alcohol dehydrogenase [Exiguobacterium sp. SH3S2]